MSIKSILDQFVRQPVRLPPAVLKRFEESKVCAPYLVSCFEKGRFLYLSPQFEKITGYAAETFKAGGVDFWFSVIHPADMQGVVNAIAKAHDELASARTLPTEPLQLEYRIKSGAGKLVWIRELKAIVSHRKGVKDCILGCLCDISAEKAAEQSRLDQLLQNGKEINGLLELAAAYQLDEHGKRRVKNSVANSISTREKQVLQLVASGCSSKQIADRLTISENTVETHRRHLLEKFQVNNSTALVKAAHELGLL